MALWYAADSADAIRLEVGWREAETTPTAPPKFATLDWRWVERVDIIPAYDPAIEVREGPVETVTATEFRREWTVRAKTALELDADKDAKVEELHRDALLALAKVQFQVINEVRALQGLGPITADQYKALLKSKL